MPISLISGGNLTGGAANGSNVTINFPTLQRNDVVYLVAGRVGGPTVTTAGYTQVGTVTSGTHVVRVFRKVMGVTPDTSVTIAGSGNTADAMSVALYCLRGVDFNTPEDATATTASGSSTNPNNPAITTVTADAWVLAAASSQVSDANVTAPTNYLSLLQLNTNDTNASTTALSYLVEVTPATEDPPSYTGWSTGAWGAITVAVRPGIDSSNNVTGVSGTGQVGTVTVRGDVSVDETGVSGTGQVGTATMRGDVSNSVTGLFATGQVGSVQTTIISQAFPTGVFGTGQVGSVTVGLINNPTVNLTGLSATGQVGSVNAQSLQIVYVTGLSASAQVGSATVQGSVSVSLTGVSAQGFVGSVQAQGIANVPVTGVSAQGLVGQVNVPIIAVDVFGVSAFGFIGNTSQWITINPDQTPAWVGVTPSTTPGWVTIIPSQVSAWSDIAPNQNPSYTPINPSQSPDWTDTAA